ncbi:MAG: MBL fold metallo-hydrolase, partial [Chloroflexota bacterium]
NGFSAHAGQDGLLAYANATRDTLKKVFLVHGEPRGAEPLMEKLIQSGIKNVFYPTPGAVFEL